MCIVTSLFVSTKLGLLFVKPVTTLPRPTQPGHPSVRIGAVTPVATARKKRRVAVLVRAMTYTRLKALAVNKAEHPADLVCTTWVQPAPAVPQRRQAAHVSDFYQLCKIFFQYSYVHHGHSVIFVYNNCHILQTWFDTGWSVTRW